MVRSSSDSSQAEYSHKATVAAITSYYELLARVHPDIVSSLEYPPSGGWPQITSEFFSILGRNDTVIELMRHIPRTHEESRAYNEEVRPVPQDKIGANPDYSPEGGGVPITSSMFTLAVLAAEIQEGFDILLETEHNIVIVVRVREEPHTEQWKVMNWMSKMEWAGQIGKRYRSAETELDETYGDGLRQKIMREAGWPGTGEEVGLGWDKAKAEKQMIELM
ncbi:uncharacterized protein CCOS01_07142 [Colletotrichum costaricense]|uniref:Uncharacterized protein n=1 Tax=Colletotrichum costaricense TaxID=1209916 RepID=A0AAI9Z0P4_9PEZI|nr:uncharacterized protein CCOS01_07142 [Colletotrichum costaricense]KAK1529308.1 hypothetical protein CCOS01_07142 [Colletotrichum costaricense]